MKFTEEKRLEIKDAILIRCSGSDYQTFQIEEIDRMVDDIDKLVNETFDYQETACRECGTELSGSELSSNTCLSCGCSPAIRIK